MKQAKTKEQIKEKSNVAKELYKGRDKIKNKEKIEVYCKNPSCFTQYLVNHKIKSEDSQKDKIKSKIVTNKIVDDVWNDLKIVDSGWEMICKGAMLEVYDKTRQETAEKEDVIIKRTKGNIIRLIISQECNTPDMAKVQKNIIDFLDKVPLEELKKKFSKENEKCK